MPRVKKQSAKTLKQRKSRNYFSAKNRDYFDLCDYKLSDTQINLAMSLIKKYRIYPLLNAQIVKGVSGFEINR